MRPTALATSLFVLLALVLAAAPAGAAGLYNPKVYRLDNGLQVVVIEDHRAPVVSHMIWYKVGAADEPAGKSGLAHFLEHLMFKGTDKLAPGEFSRIVARNGGRENAFTSYDYTGYYQDMARDKLDLVMGLEADRMHNLQLTGRNIETERQVILEERRMRTDNDPGAQLNEMMQATQYFSNPYAIPVIGWKHEIEGLSRDDIVSFYRHHYAPNNAVLVVSGDVTGPEVLKLAKKHFGPIPREEVPPRVRPEVPPQLAARRVVFRDDRVGQPRLLRSYLAPSRHSAEHADMALPLDMLSEILGGGTTSRLYRELVVKQGIAASASAWYSATSYDDTTFGISATPASGVPLDKVEAAVDQVIGKLLASGITDDELQRARNLMLASFVYARDSLFTGPRIFGEALTSGLTVQDVEDWPDMVAKVKADDIMRAARFVLQQRRSVTGELLPKAEG